MKRLHAMTRLLFAFALTAATVSANSLEAIASGADVQLSWGPRDGPAPWEVLRATSPLGPFTVIATTPSASYTDTGAVTGPPLYAYTVRSASTPALGPSNMAFRLLLGLDPPLLPGYSGARPISLPYKFHPSGIIGAPQTAHDLCLALNQGTVDGRPVQNVFRYDPVTYRFEVKSCSSSVLGFTLELGTAYFATLHRAETATVSVPIVGAHDNDYSGNKGGVLSLPMPGSSFEPIGMPVSLPYNTVALDSVELCTELNAGPGELGPIRWLMILRTGELPVTQFCVSPLAAWTVEAGRGIFVRAEVDVGIQVDVH